MAVKSLALIVTLGRRDLQFVVEVDGQHRLAPVSTKHCREVHRLLPARCSFLHPSEKPTAEARDVEILVDEGSIKILGAGVSHVLSPDGSPVLCAPILSDALTRLTSRLDPTRERIDGALLLATNRDAESGEPIAAGRLLAGWLAQELGLRGFGKVGEGVPEPVGWLEFLQKDERLEEEQDDGSVTMRRKAVARICFGLDWVRNALPGTERDRWAVVCDTGGLPGVIPVLRNAARWRFQGRVRHLETQGRPPAADPPFLSRSVQTADQELLERERVAELIRQGEFAAAAAMADLGDTRLSAYPQEWRTALDVLRAYLEGDSARSRRMASPFWEPMGRLLVGHRRLSGLISTALTIEGALRHSARRGLPEAALGTGTFVDLATISTLERLLTRPDRTKLQPEKQRVHPGFFKAITGATPEEEAALQVLRNLKVRRLSEMRAPLRDWLGTRSDPLDQATAALLASYDTGVVVGSGTTGESIRPVTTRNWFAHGDRKSEHLRKVGDVMVGAGLWGPPELPGSRFFSAPRIVDWFRAHDGSWSPHLLFDESMRRLHQALDDLGPT